MAEATLTPTTGAPLTDAEILELIRKSELEEAQKTQLQTLLPQMTGDERNELMGILNKSVDQITKADEEYQKNLAALNQEYIKKMDTLVKEESLKARKEFEVLDVKETGAELKVMESEIQKTNVVSTEAKRSGETPSRSHFLRNLVIGLVVVIAIVTVILYLTGSA